MIDSLPPVPRPLTAKARRRSWAELPLRNWLVVAIFVLLGTIYFACIQTAGWYSDKKLVEGGVPVVAHIDQIEGISRVGQVFDVSTSPWTRLTFTLPGEKNARTVALQLEPAKAKVRVGDSLPIRVDPKDWSRVTERTAARSLPRELSGVFILGPLFLIAAALVLWRRSQVLAVYRNGDVVDAVILDTKATALAPRSRLVRYALEEGGRVRSLLLPATAGNFEHGQTLPVITLKKNLNAGVAATLYSL